LEKLITILGPTASGKTQLACALAYDLNAEIISADSRQVYRQMDIGTGKDIQEYEIKGSKIPYHLINIRNAGYKYNIWEFQTDFIKAYKQINENGNKVILCGGSGLYLETALSGNTFLGIPNYDVIRQDTRDLSFEKLQLKWNEIPKEIQLKLDKSTSKRIIRALEIAHFISLNPNWKEPVYPKFDNLIIGVNISRELRREKITKRLSDRLNNGLIEEVEGLFQSGLSYDDLSYYGLEYKWISSYLQNKISKKELFEGLNIAIHQFAKRQMTWYRRMEKQGYHIHWVEAGLPLIEKVHFVKKILKKKR
jgi:tRNA dimethylallyltransferase